LKLKTTENQVEKSASKKVVTLAAVSSRRNSECRDVTNKNRKAIE
jgi:hypothetical protein